MINIFVNFSLSLSAIDLFQALILKFCRIRYFATNEKKVAHYSYYAIEYKILKKQNNFQIINIMYLIK
jgi:hypothetical protein